MKKTLKIISISAAVIALLSTIAFATGKKIEHDRKIALIALCEEFDSGMSQEKLEKVILARYPSATEMPLVFSPRRHTPGLLAAPVELVPSIDEESHIGPLLVRKSSRTGAAVDSTADGDIYNILVYDLVDFHVSVLILGQWHTLPLPKYKFSAEAYATDNCAVKS